MRATETVRSETFGIPFTCRPEGYFRLRPGVTRERFLKPDGRSSWERRAAVDLNVLRPKTSTAAAIEKLEHRSGTRGDRPKDYAAAWKYCAFGAVSQPSFSIRVPCSVMVTAVGLANYSYCCCIGRSGPRVAFVVFSGRR